MSPVTNTLAAGCEICGCQPFDDYFILGRFCSPECAEHNERCFGCGKGPSWCQCEVEYVE